MSFDISAISEAVHISTEIDDCNGSDTGGSIRFVAYTDGEAAVKNVRSALAAVIVGVDADLLVLVLEWDGPCPTVWIRFADLAAVAEFFNDGGTWRRHGLRLMSVIREMRGVCRVVGGRRRRRRLHRRRDGHWCQRRRLGCRGVRRERDAWGQPPRRRR